MLYVIGAGAITDAAAQRVVQQENKLNGAELTLTC